MPLAYDNARSPYYSETQREWAAAQAWNRGGVDTLVVYLRGEATSFLETSPGTIIMNGIGTDIWNNSDQFRFVCKQLKGNGSILARVDSIAVTNAWAKAGVMIRESLDAGSTHATAVVSGSSGLSFQRRLVASDASTSTDFTGPVAPYWVKITRSGNTFTMQHSADGVAWVDLVANPATSIAMANDVYIGLAVCSHAADAVCGAKFSNVTTTGSVSGAWQVAEIGAPQAAGNMPETFYVAVQDSAGKMKVVSNPDPTIISTGVWQAWSIPLTELTSAGLNLGSVKKMWVGIGNRTSPQAGNAGKVIIDDIRLTRTGL
jgi:regulation of enolase protein 1 (concanavalin A-like superfamily)